MAAEGKIDPMHQFVIEPIFGSFQGHNPFVFTNSALWMLIVLGTIWLFMFGGMKRELVPGRWQVAVEGLIGFVDDMVNVSIGPEGKKYLPWVFTAFIFILFANLIGTMPFGIVPAAHPFTVTSQFTVTGVMSLISFAIVLGVGFWKHGLHFFSLFVPKDAPLALQVRDRADRVRQLPGPAVQPRPAAVHRDVRRAHPARRVRQFRRPGLNAKRRRASASGSCRLLFVMFVSVLELLVAAIQAYVFAILTSLYINDAVNLH